MRTRTTTAEQIERETKRQLLCNLNKIMVTNTNKGLQENLKIMIEDIEAGKANAENINSLIFDIFDGLSTVEYKIKGYLKILLILNDDNLIVPVTNKELSEMNSLIVEDISNEAKQLSDLGQIILGIREYKE